MSEKSLSPPAYAEPSWSIFLLMKNDRLFSLQVMISLRWALGAGGSGACGLTTRPMREVVPVDNS